MALDVVIWNVILLAAGLFLLIAGSEFFVKSAASIAKRLGVSEFIIGLTLVAVGTSMPEMFSSLAASFKQQGDIVVGNIVGSNIANICLVLGITASISLIRTNDKMLSRDGYIMLLSVILFYVFIIDGSLWLLEALVLLFVYIGYLGFLFTKKQKYREQYGFTAFISYLVRLEFIKGTARRVSDYRKRSDNSDNEKAPSPGLGKELLIFVVTLMAIILGANLMIDETVYFADLLGISGTVAGLTLVALGSSLPEMGVTITAARKGFSNIAVGNIIGSCIANMLFVLALSTFVFAPTATEGIRFFFAPLMIFVTVILLVFVKSNWQIRRLEGAAFLALYVVFIILLILVP
jgi:cation:H+ antiporter